ncbi:MAG: protein phosphatase 2C domain-containing protein [Streptosporangiaceae bacterium]
MPGDPTDRQVTDTRVVLATAAGTPGWPNEDFCAVAPEAAVLLDGATTMPRGTPTGCRHGVAWYARTLGSTLLAALVGEPDTGLADALAAAIGDVRDRHAGTCDLDNPATPAATVTAVRAGPGGFSYLALSDSSIAADYGDGRPPQIVTDDHQPARATPAAAAKARTGTIGLAGLRGLALLSDGATRITDRYGLVGWPDLLSTIRERGPRALIAEVRAAEVADADGTRWPRTKASDDATIIWWPTAG